ncbi:hypothetical protein TCA2_4560 [Paenibacillus sp. TCA20]|uniref:discoidin domain-containing protein n=1 Tax=Paenibacillus sp. TCA20 TaxID=1499968 RepID=UPI0004DAB2FE|nr:discoidin domain-containing protein [Paenibacillus sp. TCA20]GAK42068.1 hypothetical protein TCA2_4560 [Paenibacillus sp. TCA20]
MAVKVGQVFTVPYSGAKENWVVPNGVTKVRIQCYGPVGGAASSGYAGNHYVAPTNGAITYYDVKVASKESFSCYVGQVGITGGTGSYTPGRLGPGGGGGGSGATQVYKDDALIVSARGGDGAHGGDGNTSNSSGYGLGGDAGWSGPNGIGKNGKRASSLSGGAGGAGGGTSIGTSTGATNSSVGKIEFIVLEIANSKYLFQDGSDIKKYMPYQPAVAGSNQIPRMTSYTAPSGAVSASAYHIQTGYAAWKAFDGTETGVYQSPSGALTVWVEYDFQRPVLISKYVIHAGQNASYLPLSWDFEGFDGENWIVLDSQDGQTNWVNGDIKSYLFSNTVSYNRYRINMKSGRSDSYYLPELEMHSPSYPEQPARWEVVGTTPVTKAMFDADGMNDTDLAKVDHAAIQLLNSENIDLLVWTDEVGAIQSYSQNQCVAGIPYAIGSFSSSSYPESYAFDNNSNTKWVATHATSIGNGAIGYQFPSPIEIRKFVIQMSNNLMTAFKVQYSDDGAAWTTATSVSGITANTTEIKIGSFGAHSYWRLLNDTMTNSMWEVVELQMMTGNPSPPSRTMDITAIPFRQLLIPTSDLTVGEIDKVRLDIVNKKPENAIPLMTSNTAPSGKASSSTYQTGSEAYKAFDSVRTAGSSSWLTASNVLTGWLAYEFPTAKVITSYMIIPYTESLSPKTWTFEGSNDGITWDVLDRQALAAWADWSPRGTSLTYSFANDVAYTKYRLNITESFGTAYVGIAVLEMYEKPVGTDLKVLLSGDSGLTWKTLKGGGEFLPAMTSNSTPAPYLVEASSVLTGASNYQPWKAFNKTVTDYTDSWISDDKVGWVSIDLGSSGSKKISEYSVTCRNWNDSQADKETTAPKSWTFEGSNDNANWAILDTQVNQISWTKAQKRSFKISNSGIYRYYRLNISDNNGAYYVAIGEIGLIEAPSFQTVNIADMAAVKSSGMTPAQVNAISASDWSNLVSSGKLRLAFYMELNNMTDILEIRKLDVNQKIHTITPSLSGISVIYNNLKISKPHFFVSRDDGGTWTEVSPDALTKLDGMPEGKMLRVKAVLRNGEEVQALSYSWV